MRPTAVHVLELSFVLSRNHFYIKVDTIQFSDDNRSTLRSKQSGSPDT